LSLAHDVVVRLSPNTSGHSSRGKPGFASFAKKRGVFTHPRRNISSPEADLKVGGELMLFDVSGHRYVSMSSRI